MVQKEVGERMISKNNVKSYNAFSAILQYHTNVTKVMDVKRTLFKPQPKVDSMVVRLEKRDQNLNERLENLYERIVKMSFAQKRKTLVNNLSRGLNLSKVILEKVIEDLKYPLNVRAESLTVKDFIELTKRIHKIIK